MKLIIYSASLKVLEEIPLPNFFRKEDLERYASRLFKNKKDKANKDVPFREAMNTIPDHWEIIE